MTRYVITDIDPVIQNTTREERIGNVTETLGQLVIWSTVLGEIYRDDSIVQTGITEFQKLLITRWPESISKVMERLTVIKGYISVDLREDRKEILNSIDGCVKKTSLAMFVNSAANFTNTTITTNSTFGQVVKDTATARLASGKILIKAGKEWGRFIDDYETLVELQREIEEKKRKKRNFFLPIFKLSESNISPTSSSETNSSETKKKYNFGMVEITKLLNFLELFSTSYMVINIMANRTLVLPEAALRYLDIMLPFQNFQGLSDLQVFFSEAIRFDIV